MSKEEEKPTRVTRGALRRMSVEQEPTSAPGTPKKSTATAATSKKLAVLDAIQEGSNGPSDAEVDENTAGRESKGKNDTTLVGNRSVHMPKEHEKKATTGRPAVSMLTVENVSKLDSFLDIRRTPRRRPSQDQTLTPQTLPKRVTRRNSVTSDDGNLGAATPKTSRTRHSIAAQAVIAEDDEKEEQTGNVLSTAEADLSDLDIRKLRNRSISKSPVPGKNTSAVSIKEGDVAATSPVKAGGEPSSSQKPEKAPVSQEDKMEESESFVDVVTVTPAKSDSAISVGSSQVSEQQQQQSQKTPAMVAAAAAVKDVKFDEGTPDQLNKSKYPKTPVAVAAGGKRRKLSELAAEAAADEDESLTTDSEIIIVDETIKDSPQVVKQKPETPKTPTKASASPKKEATKLIIIDETIKDSPRKSSQEAASPKTPSKANGTPKKTTPKKSQDEASEESPDKSIDASIANIVEQVREEMNQSADLSMSILGTPKPTTGGKHKSHFSHLREGSSSTPIAAKHAALGEIPEEDPKEDTSMGSKSWSQAVKGSGQDKGIDVFSVRKKEEEEKQEEETKTLNESLKRKSLEKMQPLKVDEDGEEGEEEEDEDEIDVSQKRSSFVDDEAMEVNGYQSGDSMDSETRAEIEDNQVEDDGESIGSQDTDEEDEEDGDDDSFIASDGEEVEDLLEGTGNELHSEEEADKSSTKNKKRKRILLQEDSSEDEKETSKAEKTLNETATSETKSPKKDDSSSVSKTHSPRKTPLKTVEVKSPKKTPIEKAVDKDEEQEESAEHSEDPQTDKAVAESPRSAKKTPSKASLSTDVPEQQKSAKKNTTEVSESPKSPKKTPSKPSLESETQLAKSAEKRRSSKTSESENVSEVSKSRKSLPAPALISADFYSSSAKKAKRNTIDLPAADEEELDHATQKEEVNSNLVTNPAALALAKKNRRLSQGLSPATKQDKRASLPGKLPDESEVGSPLKKKSNKKQVDSVENANDSVEPMEVDEDEEEQEEEVAEKQPSPKKPAVVAKKKPRDLSDFDTEAILSRCNEIVRADKEKRKEGATLRQKKKDEKRRQREQEQQEDAADGEANDESTEQQKKKKKKKKKQVNYLLEELGETKEDQVARALQRKMALLEAKRERKKAKKAAKLREQLNKENQQEGKQTTSVKASEGIAAKLEKQTKKTKKMEKEVKKAILEELRPVVRRAVSAFAMYSEQIEDMKKEKTDKKKPKSKQLKEKNQQPTAVEEVQAALQAKPDAKPKKDKVPKQKQASADQVQPPVEHPKVDKKKEVVEEPVKEEPAAVKHKKKENLTAVKSDELPPKKKHHEPVNTAPLKSVVSLDDELAQLKKSLSEPVAKVVKKQKLSHKESSIATVTAREVTPPRKATTGKLKALARLEAGFQEEPITPDHKLLKRNHGFKEEPVTPKSVGFKVSSVLPAGQEALKQEAVEAKRKKIYHNTNRIRPEDVREPARGLPLPVWTRSGTFEVEELEETKSRKTSKAGSDYVPLSVNSTTEFLVKPLGGKSKHSGESKTSSGGGISKVHRIDADTVDEAVINFKKQAIFGKNAHLREKKRKH